MLKPLSGHQQITDAFLLSLAVANKGTLVSFDKGITAIVQEKYMDKLMVVDF